MKKKSAVQHIASVLNQAEAGVPIAELIRNSMDARISNFAKGIPSNNLDAALYAALHREFHKIGPGRCVAGTLNRDTAHIWIWLQQIGLSNGRRAETAGNDACIPAGRIVFAEKILTASAP